MRREMVNNASRGEKFRGEVSSRRWGELSVVRRPCGADHFGPSYFLPNKGARGGLSLSGIFPRFCFEHKARSGRSPFRSERISPTFLVYTEEKTDVKERRVSSKEYGSLLNNDRMVDSWRETNSLSRSIKR